MTPRGITGEGIRENRGHNKVYMSIAHNCLLLLPIMHTYRT